MAGSGEMVAVAVDRRITDSDRSLMMYLLGIMEGDGLIPRTQADIAMDLGKNRVTITNALGRLADAGYIMRDTGRIVRVNPNLAFQGSGADHQRLLQRLPAAPEIQRPILPSEQKAERKAEERRTGRASRGGRHARPSSRAAGGTGGGILRVVDGGAS